MKYIMSFGGGINSTAMYFVLRENNFPLDEIIFADTGAEMSYTYELIAIFSVIVKQDGITFTIVKSGLGDIYKYYYKHEAVPSRMRRDCTSKFKISPIRKHLRKKYGDDEQFTQYLGISYEEANRMRTSDVKYITNTYPLIDMKIDRDGCERILTENGLVGIKKSGCYICPFTRKKGWIDLMNEYPDLFEKAIRLEENCSNKKVGLASKSLKFFKEYKGQTSLKDYEYSCDVAGGCFQ